uniref:ATPase subunit 8 n=1 Tax=Rhopalaea idoneta TaxID=1712670 RepID=A0A173QSZ5_9ASCI|nr:ATPase subunit 8 [Rhopalaea idoneta]
MPQMNMVSFVVLSFFFFIVLFFTFSNINKFDF